MGSVVIFVDFQFEDMEVMYPKIRLEEEGFRVLIVGGHPKGMKYTGKYGYPVVSDLQVDDVTVDQVDALILPGGFAPDYMRRNTKMLNLIVELNHRKKPIAAICHGPWMLCSARQPDGKPIVDGRQATSFVAIKDDLVNAGAVWLDAPVVIDANLITSRTPGDLTPFCRAIISALKSK